MGNLKGDLGIGLLPYLRLPTLDRYDAMRHQPDRSRVKLTAASPSGGGQDA
jgi:hypothetical protein